MFVRKRGVSASSGTGMMMLTLLAVLRRLNCAFACRDRYYVVTKTAKGMFYLQHVLDPAP